MSHVRCRKIGGTTGPDSVPSQCLVCTDGAYVSQQWWTLDNLSTFLTKYLQKGMIMPIIGNLG